MTTFANVKDAVSDAASSAVNAVKVSANYLGERAGPAVDDFASGFWSKDAKDGKAAKEPSKTTTTASAATPDPMDLKSTSLTLTSPKSAAEPTSFYLSQRSQEGRREDKVYDAEIVPSGLLNDSTTIPKAALMKAVADRGNYIDVEVVPPNRLQDSAHSSQLARSTPRGNGPIIDIQAVTIDEAPAKKITNTKDDDSLRAIAYSGMKLLGPASSVDTDLSKN